VFLSHFVTCEEEVKRQAEMVMASFIPTCCLFLLQKCGRGKEKSSGNDVELFVDLLFVFVAFLSDIEEQKMRWAAMPTASCTNLFVVVAFHNVEKKRKRGR